MATTAGRGCQRTGYARKPCPDKRGRVDRNRAGGHFRDGDKIEHLILADPVPLVYEPLFHQRDDHIAPPKVNALRYSVERNSLFSTWFLLFIRFVSNLTRPCAALL